MTQTRPSVRLVALLALVGCAAPDEVPSDVPGAGRQDVELGPGGPEGPLDPEVDSLEPAAQPGPTGEQLLAVSRLRAAGRLTRVRWSEAPGAPIAAWGRLSEGLSSDPRVAFHEFVSEHAVLLGLDQAAPGVALEVDHVLTRRGVHHVRAVRRQEGVELRGDEILLHINEAGAVIGVQAALPLAARRAAPPTTIDREAAEAIARMAYDEPIRVEIRQVFAEAALGGGLLWEVVVVPLETGAATRWDIDAATGEVLDVVLVAPTVGHVTSCVFEEKPSLWGRDEVDVSGLWVTTATGQALTALDGTFDATGEVSFVLEGPACSVVQIDGSRYSYQGDPAADVCFGYFDSRFAEVSAFYHVTKASRLFATRYAFTHPDVQLEVVVNDTADHFNAFYRGNSLYFGKGLGIFPMSVSLDVVTHEFTHFVTDTLAAGGAGIWYDQYTQVGAISEGYSDYFPASYRGDPKFNDAFQPWFGRALDNDDIYPDDYNAESHDGGRIWGGFLWDVRGALGADVADFLAFEAIAFIPSRGNFLDGRDALLAADDLLYGGAHAGTLHTVAEGRGFVDERRVYARALGRKTGFAPHTVELVGGYSGFYGEPVALSWDFDDGGVSSEGRARHVYARGKYEPTFTVTDAEASLSESLSVRSCQASAASWGAVLLALGVWQWRARRRRIARPVRATQGAAACACTSVRRSRPTSCRRTSCTSGSIASPPSTRA